VRNEEENRRAKEREEKRRAREEEEDRKAREEEEKKAREEEVRKAREEEVRKAKEEEDRKVKEKEERWRAAQEGLRELQQQLQMEQALLREQAEQQTQGWNQVAKSRTYALRVEFECLDLKEKILTGQYHNESEPFFGDKKRARELRLDQDDYCTGLPPKKCKHFDNESEIWEYFGSADWMRVDSSLVPFPIIVSSRGRNL